MPLLEIENLNFSYNEKRQALFDINLKLESGRIVAVLGENGCGKTTLFKIISGFLQPYSGQVLIGGRPPLAPEAKAMLSYQPDRFIYPLNRSAESLIKEFSDVYLDFDTEKASRLLKECNLPSTGKIKTWSKGMREKFQTIISLSRKADIYLLDEPVAGVDPASRDTVLNLILENFDRDSLMLISTQVISEIEVIFDDVLFMNQGRILDFDSADNLRSANNMSIDGIFRARYR